MTSYKETHGSSPVGTLASNQPSGRHKEWALCFPNASSSAGLRRGDRWARHLERGLVQRQHADHAATKGQPHCEYTLGHKYSPTTCVSRAASSSIQYRGCCGQTMSIKLWVDSVYQLILYTCMDHINTYRLSICSRWEDSYIMSLKLLPPVTVQCVDITYITR